MEEHHYLTFVAMADTMPVLMHVILTPSIIYSRVKRIHNTANNNGTKCHSLVTNIACAFWHLELATTKYLTTSTVSSRHLIWISLRVTAYSTATVSYVMTEWRSNKYKTKQTSDLPLCGTDRQYDNSSRFTANLPLCQFAPLTNLAQVKMVSTIIQLVSSVARFQ